MEEGGFNSFTAATEKMPGKCFHWIIYVGEKTDS